MIRLIILQIGLCLGCFAATSNKVEIEHSIDGKNFVAGGHLILHSGLRETPSKGLAFADNHEPLIDMFSKEDLENSSSYRIRLPVMRIASCEILTGGALQGHVEGFIPMSVLKAACYAHEVHLYLDQLGTVYGLSILPLSCSSSSLTVPIKVFQTESVAGPDTKGFLQKIEEERARKARQPVDNRSFFQKYWVYIVVGLVAFTLLSGGGQQGGEGGGQAQ